LDSDEEEPEDTLETAGGMAAETYEEVRDETGVAASEFPDAAAIGEELTEEGEAEDVYAEEPTPSQNAATSERTGVDLPKAGNDDDPNAATPPRAANDDEPKSA
jgi:hypothetical protein